ncbi:MAG: hypothetical protein NTZ57_08355, partial [Deltaproteobacteria bacterium]|nr:hypothetical protein [Deltaproteobacteria bacterium]
YHYLPLKDAFVKTMICLDNGKQSIQTCNDDEDREYSDRDDDTPAYGNILEKSIQFPHGKNLAD